MSLPYSWKQFLQQRITAQGSECITAFQQLPLNHVLCSQEIDLSAFLSLCPIGGPFRNLPYLVSVDALQPPPPGAIFVSTPYLRCVSHLLGDKLLRAGSGLAGARYPCQKIEQEEGTEEFDFYFSNLG